MKGINLEIKYRWMPSKSSKNSFLWESKNKKFSRIFWFIYRKRKSSLFIKLINCDFIFVNIDHVISLSVFRCWIPKTVLINLVYYYDFSKSKCLYFVSCARCPASALGLDCRIAPNSKSFSAVLSFGLFQACFAYIILRNVYINWSCTVS